VSFDRDIDRPCLLCSDVVKCVRRKIGEIVRYLLDKQNKISPTSQTVRYGSDRTQNLPGPAPNNVLRVLQISSKPVHFGGVIAERVNTAKLPHRMNPIFGESLAWSRIKRDSSVKQARRRLCNACAWRCKSQRSDIWRTAAVVTAARWPWVRDQQILNWCSNFDTATDTISDWLNGDRVRKKTYKVYCILEIYKFISLRKCRAAPSCFRSMYYVADGLYHDHVDFVLTYFSSVFTKQRH